MDKKMTYQEYKEYRKTHPNKQADLSHERANTFGFTAIRTPTLLDRIKLFLHP